MAIIIEIKVRKKGDITTWEQTLPREVEIHGVLRDAHKFASTFAAQYDERYEVRMNYKGSYQGYYFRGGRIYDNGDS